MNEQEINLDEMKKIDELKKLIMKKILTKEAIERLGRIRLVKPDLAAQLELYLVQLFQEGKIKREISDRELKMILDSLTAKKEFKILK
ncbi:MAG TPA: DNA-binding protein [archaeon]|nr:DNA-binding protein [archaeon]